MSIPKSSQRLWIHLESSSLWSHQHMNMNSEGYPMSSPLHRIDHLRKLSSQILACQTTWWLLGLSTCHCLHQWTSILSATAGSVFILKTSTANCRCQSCVHRVIKVLGINKLTQWFDEVVTNLLYQLASVTEVVLWERWCQPYFNEDCCNAWKKAHLLEKIFKADRKPQSRSN